LIVTGIVVHPSNFAARSLRSPQNKKPVGCYDNGLQEADTGYVGGERFNIAVVASMPLSDTNVGDGPLGAALRCGVFLRRTRVATIVANVLMRSGITGAGSHFCASHASRRGVGATTTLSAHWCATLLMFVRRQRGPWRGCAFGDQILDQPFDAALREADTTRADLDLNQAGRDVLIELRLASRDATARLQLSHNTFWHLDVSLYQPWGATVVREQTNAVSAKYSRLQVFSGVA
jgi:hypothetical protein